MKKKKYIPAGRGKSTTVILFETNDLSIILYLSKANSVYRNRSIFDLKIKKRIRNGEMAKESKLTSNQRKLNTQRH